VPLSMFCLDTVTLNSDLCARAQRLKERLITHEVDDNRDLNKGFVSFCILLNITEKKHGRYF